MLPAQGQGYAAEVTWMAQKMLGKEPGLEKAPTPPPALRTTQLALSHPPLETQGYCSA